MKTHGESERINRPIKSSLSKKSSKSQRLRKRVRFDFPKRLASLNAALYEGCVAHSKTLGFDYSHCGNQLKSQSCDNFWRLEPLDKARTWQSVTCLAPPSCPSFAQSSSASWITLPRNKSMISRFNSEGCNEFQPGQEIVRKSNTRLLSCKHRIPTPRWIRSSIYPVKNPEAFPSPNFHNIAHSSKDFCVENPTVLDGSVKCFKSPCGWPLPSSEVNKNSKIAKSFKGQKRFFVEDLSYSIERLQIKPRNTKFYPRLTDVRVKSNLNLAYESNPNQQLRFDEMDSCVCLSNDNIAKQDSDESDFDINNSSVQKNPKQDVSNQAQTSSREIIIQPSTAETKITDSRTCSSKANRHSGCPGTACNMEKSILVNTSSLVKNISQQSLPKPGSSSSDPSNRCFMLARSFSADSVTTKTCSASSTINPNFELLAHPEDEIDEDFWQTVCPDNSSHGLTSHTENCGFTATTELDNAGETNKPENVHALDILNSLKNSINCCNRTSLDTNHGSDKNQSSVVNECSSKTLAAGELQNFSTANSTLYMPSTSKIALSMESRDNEETTSFQTETLGSVSNPVLRESVSEPLGCVNTNDVKTEQLNAQACINNLKSNKPLGEGKTKIERIYQQDALTVEFDNNTREITVEDVSKPLLMCCVLNCGVQFSEPCLLNEHLTQMNHSPCNPLATILDGAESLENLQFLCPQCGDSFQSEELCQSHMFQVRHSCLLPPVPSSAYACPECLRLFSDISTAQQHIETLSHYGYAFYFTDDGEASNRSQPIPVPQRLMRELVARCRRVLYTLVCQDCGLGLSDSTELRSHLDSRHIVAAKCCTSVRDVFADLLTDQACAECGQFIYQGLPPTGMCLHIDCPFRGPVLSWRARTLREFLLRCGISGINVGTELNLHCYRQTVHLSSPLVLTNNRMNDGKGTTEVKQINLTTPVRSLSEPVLQLEDVNGRACCLAHIKASQPTYNSRERERTVSNTFSNVYTGQIINNCSSPGEVTNFSNKIRSAVTQLSSASTSAACNDSVANTERGSYRELRSYLTYEPPTSFRNACLWSRNSQASSGTTILSSCNNSQSNLFGNTDMNQEEGDGKNFSFNESLDSFYTPNNERVSADKLDENTTPQARRELIKIRDIEMPVHTYNSSLQEKTLLPESTSESLTRTASTGAETTKSNKMVFGSKASLDKDFRNSHPVRTFGARNVCDQSTQVGSNDYCNFSSPTKLRLLSFLQARNNIVSRLTTTVIPQTDTICLSSMTEKLDKIKKRTENKDNKSKEDANCRYFPTITPKGFRHNQTNLKKDRFIRLSRYQPRGKRTSYCKVTQKKKVKVKRLKRCTRYVKVSSYVSKRVSKKVQNQAFLALSELCDSPKGMEMLPKSAKPKSCPHLELRGNKSICRSPQAMDFGFEGKGVKNKICDTPEKSESTYAIVNIKDRVSKKYECFRSINLGTLTSNGEISYKWSKNPKRTVCGLDKTSLNVVKQELQESNEAYTTEDESSYQLTEEPRYYIVKREVKKCPTFACNDNKGESKCKEGSPTIGTLYSDISQYNVMLLTKTKSINNNVHEDQPTCSYLFKDGHFGALTPSRFDSVIDAQSISLEECSSSFLLHTENAQVTKNCERYYAQQENLGTKLALQTKLPVSLVQEERNEEGLHYQDRFKRMSNCMSLNDLSDFFNASSVSKPDSTTKANKQALKDIEEKSLSVSSASRCLNTLSQLQPTLHPILSEKRKGLCKRDINGDKVVGPHDNTCQSLTSQSMTDRTQTEPLERSLKRSVASEAQFHEDEETYSYKVSCGPQTRSRRLCKRRVLLTNENLQKKSQQTKRKTTFRKRMTKCKRKTKTNIGNRGRKPYKTTSKRVRKLQKKQSNKKCVKPKSKDTIYALDKFVSLRKKQHRQNKDAIACNNEIFVKGNNEIRYKTRQHGNYLLEKERPKCRFSPPSPCGIKPALNADLDSSSEINTEKLDMVPYSGIIIEKKQTTQNNQSKGMWSTKEKVEERQKTLEETKAKSKGEANVLEHRESCKNQSLGTNEIKDPKQPNTNKTLSASVQESSLQVAPRLVHSLMLSLDGPSSSRSSVLSHPSTTRASTSGNSQSQTSSLSPIPGHIRNHKLRTPKIQLLSSMSSIVFADLENFMFFKHFRGQLPPSTFVWGFVSARPGQPFHREKYFRKFSLYCKLKSKKCTHVSTDIGYGKDAVDFAMTLAIAKLDDRLPASIPFYIVSSDGGFREVENQMRRARREVKVIAPRKHSLTSAGFA